MQLEDSQDLSILKNILNISGPDQVVLSTLPLHVILAYMQENDNVRRIVALNGFWKLWVKTNVSPRHDDEFIDRIPGLMNWRYYARLYGVFEASVLHMEQSVGDKLRFFPYRTGKGFTKVSTFSGELFFLVNGKLAVDPYPSPDPEPLIFSESPKGERYVDFVLGRAFHRIGTGDKTKFELYLLTDIGKVYMQEVTKRNIEVAGRKGFARMSREKLFLYIVARDELPQPELIRPMTKEELVEKAFSLQTKRVVFGELRPTNLVNEMYVVKITNSHVVGEKGDVYPYEVDGDATDVLVMGRRVAERCIFFSSGPIVRVDAIPTITTPKPKALFVGVPPASMILLDDLSGCPLSRPLDVRTFTTSLRMFGAENDTKAILMDWTAKDEGNSYLFVEESFPHEEAASFKGRVNLLPKSNLPAKPIFETIHSPRPGDRPMVIGKVRGWVGSNAQEIDAAWTTEGLLYKNTGNVNFYFGKKDPSALFPTAGIPDFVVGCVPRKEGYVSLAIPTVSSQSRTRGLEDLIVEKGEESLRELARALLYPESVHNASSDVVFRSLAGEEEDVLLDMIARLGAVSEEARKLLIMPDSLLRNLGSREGVSLTRLTEGQFVYSIAVLLAKRKGQ